MDDDTTLAQRTASALLRAQELRDDARMLRRSSQAALAEVRACVDELRALRGLRAGPQVRSSTTGCAES